MTGVRNSAYLSAATAEIDLRGEIAPAPMEDGYLVT